MPAAEPSMSRRTLLAASAGVAAAAAAPTVAAQDDGDLESYLADANNYDGIEDHTGEDAVTVSVGAGDNGLAFGPPAIRVSQGTTVTWEWTGEGGPHNVSATDDSFRSGDATPEAGTTFEHTFEESGTTRYVCEPHEGAGMLGAVVVAAPDPTPEIDEYLDDTDNYDGIEDLRGEDTVTVDVGAGDDGLLFGPAAIRVDPGTTVVWEWTGSGGTHNVDAVDGTFSSGSAESGSDVTFEYTFEETGYWLYNCTPHEALGMKGAVVVGDAGAGAGGGGGGGGGAGGDGTVDGLTFGAVAAVLLFPVAFALALLGKELRGNSKKRGRTHR